MSIIAHEKNNSLANIDTKKDLIKRLFCKGCSDDELELFIHACQRTGLDPFMKQIYAIKRGPGMTIQTGIDGFRLIAERSGNYSPGKESTFTYDEKGALLSATSYIKKKTNDGQWHEIASTAYLEEYNAKQGLWNKMPRAMLSKCAEALALRRAFPAELSGLYSQEEMDQAVVTLPVSEPQEEEGPLTEQQCGEIDMLFLQVHKKELHHDKIKAFLKIDDIYKAPTSKFKTMATYLDKVIQAQTKEEENESVA